MNHFDLTRPPALSAKARRASQKMRILAPVFLLLLSATMTLANSSFPSPDGAYDVKITEDEFRVRILTIMHGDKQLFSTSSGYGGYTAISWSPDSRYLAVVEHGTKTTMTLAAYLIEPGGVKRITLPDYRLNILGRYQKVDGGRYRFDEDLRWRRGDFLEFVTRGSLVDGASNPQDHPDNWFSFVVGIEFWADCAHLRSVTPKNDTQIDAKQTATDPNSRYQGNRRNTKPESKGRSR